MGAFRAFGEAFRQVRVNPAPAALFLLAYLALGLIELKVIGLGPEYIDLGYFFKLAAFEAAFGLVFLLAVPVYALALADRKSISLGTFMRFNARKYIALLIAGVLYGLAVIGSFLIFIIPAIWVIAWFAAYEMAVIDKNMGPVQALKESKRLLRRHKGKVWGLIGVSFLLAIPVSLLQWVPVVGTQLAAVISQLVVILTTATAALLYRWAQPQSD